MNLTPTQLVDFSEIQEMGRWPVCALAVLFLGELSATGAMPPAWGDPQATPVTDADAAFETGESGELFGDVRLASGVQTGRTPPPAPVVEQPPMPPAVRPPADNAFHQVAPWNPAPPTGLKITPPGSEYPSVKVTGFFQADALWFHQDDDNIRTVGDAPDGAGFRRARLAATGDVFEDVGYMIEMDFAAPGRPSFMDVYMDLRNTTFLPGTLRVGQWRMPFGMDALTSVRELRFLERATMFTFVPFRQIGAGLMDEVKDDNTTWAISGYRYPTDVFGNNVGDNGGYSLATRETIVFGGDGDGDPLLHLGGDYSYTSSSFDTFRFLSTPEVAVSEVAGPVTPSNVSLNTPTFVDTGLLAAESMNLFGAELAGRAGSWHAQGEVYLNSLNRVDAANNFFWGGYAQVGYVLTGETVPYSRANGVFTRIIPDKPVTKHGGCGAWELMGRWSTIDLDDNDVRGGQLTDFTAGLNWYLNPRTKIQFNYIHAFLNRVPEGAGASVASLDSHADILAARAQIDF